MTIYPDPLSEDVNPYDTPEPIPYNPEEPDLPDPVDAPPPPEREYLTAEEAIARQAS